MNVRCIIGLDTLACCKRVYASCALVGGRVVGVYRSSSLFLALKYSVASFAFSWGDF